MKDLEIYYENEIRGRSETIPSFRDAEPELIYCVEQSVGFQFFRLKRAFKTLKKSLKNLIKL
jgi:hypothetical protein